MASWQDLKRYVHANYKVADEDSGMIKLIFDTGDLRSQVVLLFRQTLRDGEEEWVCISSPVGKVGSVDPEQFLREAGNVVCGAAEINGDLLCISHSVPLLNLDGNEVARPLALVAVTADRLERKFLGEDTF
jgi:hypothetical protein